MNHATLSDEERKSLLRMAGVDDEAAEIIASEPAHTIDEVADLEEALASLPVEPVTESVTEPVVDEIAPDGESTTADALVERILSRAKGNKETALAMCQEAAQREFDRIKLSKKAAYALGLDDAGKTEHNKNAWKATQALADTLKSGVRAKFAETGGFVKAKVSKKKANIAMMNDPRVQEFIASLNKETA